MIKKFTWMHLAFYSSLISSFYTGMATAEENNEWLSQFKIGDVELSSRLRVEHASNATLKNAMAATNRLELNYTTEEIKQFKYQVGLIDVSTLYGQRYNPNASDITRPTYNKIYDPIGTGLTLANLSYIGLKDTNITIGRQFIMLDNERFIGKNNFRQFPNSYDSLTFQTKALYGLDIFYGSIFVFNNSYANGRTPEGKQKLFSNLLNIEWYNFKYGSVTGYMYLNNNKTLKHYSNLTYGFRISSQDENNENKFHYLIEAARQESKFNNPNSYNAYYWHLVIGKIFDNIGINGGWEHFSGDKDKLQQQFTLNMGSNNDFNGLTQMFVEGIPHKGLDDFYIHTTSGNEHITLDLGLHMFTFSNILNKRVIGYEANITSDLYITKNMKLSGTYAKFISRDKINYPSQQRFYITLNLNLI